MNKEIRKILKEGLGLTDDEISEIDEKIKEIHKRHIKEAKEIGLIKEKCRYELS